ncbi:hypothetical protein [Poriferisphaera sp. WC338]|uniref:hypothetical protein n=1 Tax=Poriferisphaera sp. WC338 TaxID=3425129 RepID=UPI003D81C2B2
MNILMTIWIAGAESTTAVTQEGAGGNPWWHVLIQSAFGLTVLFIFLVAVVSMLLSQRRKDKCLKLLHDYHVSTMSKNGSVMWGDLVVYSKGLELVYDAPYVNRKGLCKTSSLMYAEELENVVAIGRSRNVLSDREIRDRKRQIKRTFYPVFYRRWWRACRNLINTLRDAFSKALTALVGQMAKVKTGNVANTQQQGINEIGQTILGAAGNAYEPMLERHIGKRVVMRVKFIAGEAVRTVEVPGYLAEYTENYVAVFNTGQKILHRDEIEIKGEVSREGYVAKLEADQLRVTNTGENFVVVREVALSKRTLELGVTLLPGSSIEVHYDTEANDDKAVKIVVEVTREIDLVCPRSMATVYYGGSENRAGTHAQDNVVKPHGIAPEAAAEELTQEDENADGSQ